MSLLSEPATRLTIFLALLGIFSLVELLAPRRRPVAGLIRRRVSNLLLLGIGTLIVRVVPVLSAVGAAAWAGAQGIGLLNVLDWLLWGEVLLTLLLFDLLIYAQHVASHHVPMLWDFHKVHHADLDLDATSGLRFHPVEILLSMALKCVAAIALGAPPGGVALFEIVLNSTALFNHANLALPLGIDRGLRLLLVTPDMHRIHHSVKRHEADSNYGFNLPWWDRLFGTYTDQPEGTHATLELGLAEERDTSRTGSLTQMLKMPFEGS